MRYLEFTQMLTLSLIDPMETLLSGTRTTGQPLPALRVEAPEGVMFAFVRVQQTSGDDELWLPCNRTSQLLNTPNDQLATVATNLLTEVQSYFDALYPARTPGFTRVRYETSSTHDRTTGEYSTIVSKVTVFGCGREVFTPLAQMRHGVYHRVEAPQAYDDVCEAARNSPRKLIVVYADDIPRDGHKPDEPYRGSDQIRYCFDEQKLHNNDCYLRYSCPRSTWEIVYDPEVADRRLNPPQRASRAVEYKCIPVSDFNSVIRSLSGMLNGDFRHDSNSGWSRGRYCAAHEMARALRQVIAMYGPTAPWTSSAFRSFLKLWRKKHVKTRDTFGYSHAKLFDYLDYAVKCRMRKTIALRRRVPEKCFHGLL